MGLPTRVSEHHVAHLKASSLRFQYAANGAADHHAADCYRFGVGRPIAHATTHVGVQREVKRLQEHFAVARRGHGTILKAERIKRGNADGALGKNDATMHGGVPTEKEIKILRCALRRVSAGTLH